jgi:hypothetical protein
MNPFYDAFLVTGLSNEEGADYLDVNMQNLLRWKNGTYNAPEGVIQELRQLREAIELVAEGHEIELGYSGAKKEAERERIRLQLSAQRGNT